MYFLAKTSHQRYMTESVPHVRHIFVLHSYRQSLFKAALYTIVPRSPFFAFCTPNIAGYKNAVECLLQ